MKTIIYYLAFILNFFSNPVYCDDSLKEPLQSIRELKGGNELIASVTRDGPITIKTVKNFPFEAYWDPSDRTIGIRTTQNQIYSLLFELQNAASQREFDHYDYLASSGKISKDDYVRSIEAIEYQNTMKTTQLVDEGIRLGVFPEKSQTRYHASFEEHFRDQVASGHSADIGKAYDRLTSS